MPKIDSDKGRFYQTPYGELPSVTSILSLLDHDGKSGALMGWAVKVMALYLKTLANAQGDIVIKASEVEDIFKKAKAEHKRIKEEAGDTGSQVHNLIEVYLKGQPVDGLLAANPKLNAPFEAFKKWKESVNFELVATERQVCDERGFAGTLDCLAKLNGKLYCIDFKSSSRISDTYFMQICAYAEASKAGMFYNGAEWAESNYEIEGWGVLRLDKETGEPEWKEVDKLKADVFFEIFMSLCYIWHELRLLKDND